MNTVEITKRWAMVSYHVFKHLASDPVLSNDFKVHMVDTHFFFKKSVEEDPAQLQKMQEIARSGVSGFRHDKRIIHSHGLDEDTWVDAYQVSSPVVDTDAALVRITELVRAKGAKLETRSIEGNLRAQEATLLKEYSANAIVNASGLGSHELAGDRDVYPLRGAVLRLLNDGKKFPKINKALVVSATAEGDVETEYATVIICYS
jgi:D-amino-acid oxidase